MTFSCVSWRGLGPDTGGGFGGIVVRSKPPDHFPTSSRLQVPEAWWRIHNVQHGGCKPRSDVEPLVICVLRLRTLTLIEDTGVTMSKYREGFSGQAGLCGGRLELGGRGSPR